MTDQEAGVNQNTEPTKSKKEEEKNLVQWCKHNLASVRFMKSGVKIKVSDLSHAISGKSLQDAISYVEEIREERKQTTEALESLKRDEHFPTRDSSYGLDR